MSATRFTGICLAFGLVAALACGGDGAGTDLLADSPDTLGDPGLDRDLPRDETREVVPADLPPDVPPDVPDEAPDLPPDDGEDADAPSDPGPQDPGPLDSWDAPDTLPEGTCAVHLPATEPGTCVVEPGNSWTLIQGHLLVPREDTPDGFLRNGQLLIDPDGTILGVGCGTPEGYPDAVGATKILCRDVVVTPGLINGHDHITYTGNTPKAHGTERYDHRNDWRTGEEGHKALSISSTEGQEAWGELRNVLAGTTSMFGAGAGPGLLRNLDEDPLEGIDPSRKPSYVIFPLGDLDGTLLTSGCGYPSLPNPAKIAAKACWVPHVAEGINAAARNELLCMSSASGGGVNAMLPHHGFVHGIGLLASDIAAMSGRFESLIWSPRSNIDLYGNTASVTVYARFGANIGIGSDWTASGSMNMVRELRCADDFNATNLGAYFGDRDLLDMATVNNAKAFHLDDRIGLLAVGRLGDVSLWNAAVHGDERAVLDAAPGDVLLVMRGGRVLFGEKELVKALTADDAGCQDDLDLCGAPRRACVLRETGSTLADLAAKAGYPLFYCDVPAGEPSCLPARIGEYDGIPKEGDLDGDGVPDATDDCPTVFNPARPLDDAAQADWDGDGLGDACDACPMDEGDACRPVAGDDLDGDLTLDDLDKCPTMPDDGADLDGDGKGDRCDPCPAIPNPGAESCPGTIYEVKTGIVALGQPVRIRNVLVTGIGATAGEVQGFFVQHVDGDPAWSGSADFSGLFCYHPAATGLPKVGDRVDVDGTPALYKGEIELVAMTAVVVASSGNPAPAPVGVAAADVATGGAKAGTMEGVLVTVADVTVTDVAPAAGSGDKAPINEFVVTGGLRVNDFLHLAAPFPLVDDGFTSITGVLRTANGNSKIEPRDEADLVRAPLVPRLVAFGPPQVFALEGETAEPIPGLKVRLQRAVDVPVTVTVSSGTPDRLDLPDGGAVVIPAGALEAPVPVIAKVADAVTVTLTAQLDATTLTADVRVVGTSETPLLAGAAPESLDLVAGDDGTWTLATDLPNFGTAPLPIALAADPGDIATVPATADVAPRSLGVVATIHGVAAGDTTITATLGVSTLTLPVHVAAAPLIPRVFFSEYVEGTSNNKAVEIYNGTGADLPLDSCTLQLFANGATTATSSTPLAATGTLPAGGAYVLCNAQAIQVVKDRCQAQTSVVNFNGDDALVLSCDGKVTDVFGQVGFQPTSGAWGVTGASTSTKDHTLRRKCGIGAGDPDGTDAFDPALEWDGLAVDTFDGLGAHVKACL